MSYLECLMCRWLRMKIIVFSDIHGDIENMLMYLDKIKEMSFDVIVCPGDFTDLNTPKGFTQEDVAKLILKELKTLKKPILTVPGNMDTKEILSFFEKEGVSIHGKGKVIDEYGFYGFGGAKTPFNTNIEPSEEEIKAGLEKGWEDIKNTKFKIQVTHNPPFRTKIDIISSGIHVGSKTVRKFIEENKPIVAISAHIHEAKGVDYIGNTLILNSGRFPEGYFGKIEIKDGSVNGKVLNILE